jgi:hypothetical protein
MNDQYQAGKIFLTKTRKYINPVLREWGPEFLENLRLLYTVRSGIGDMYYQSVLNVIHEAHVFILINTDLSDCRDNMEEVLDYFRSHESYETDYPFDDIKNGTLHMIVFKVPEKYKESLTAFRRSKFSQMYTKKQLEDLFKKETTEYKVLSQDSKYRFEFEEKINNLSSDNLELTKIVLPKNAELDFRIKEESEVFRFHK